MFSLSTKSDYGLLLLSLLAKNKNKENYISITKLAKKNHLPSAFISRIASELKSADILESKEGTSGGYKLKISPAKINIAQVVEILDGSIAPTRCTNIEEKCDFKKICPMMKNWQSVLQGKMLQILRNYSLRDLMEK